MKREALTLLVFILTAGASMCVANETKSSDDGKANNTIQLVLNVDDIANHPDTANGIVSLWNNRVISSTTIIAFGSDFEHTVKVLKENKIPVGIHLALNHGPGVLPASEVPSLHAPDGSLWNTVEETMGNLVLSEAEAEFEAQIEKVIAAGVTPIHLDSHMGLLYRRPEMNGLIVKLGKKYKLAVALPANESFDSDRKEMESVSLKSSISLSGVYAMEDGKEESLANRTEAYRKLLGRLKPGINYCFSHPVPYSESMKNTFGDYEIRGNDYALFMSPKWKEMLKEAGVELVSHW